MSSHNQNRHAPAEKPAQSPIVTEEQAPESPAGIEAMATAIVVLSPEATADLALVAKQKEAIALTCASWSSKANAIESQAIALVNELPNPLAVFVGKDSVDLIAQFDAFTSAYKGAERVGESFLVGMGNILATAQERGLIGTNRIWKNAQTWHTEYQVRNPGSNLAYSSVTAYANNIAEFGREAFGIWGQGPLTKVKSLRKDMSEENRALFVEAFKSATADDGAHNIERVNSLAQSFLADAAPKTSRTRGATAQTETKSDTTVKNTPSLESTKPTLADLSAYVSTIDPAKLSGITRDGEVCKDALHVYESLCAELKIAAGAVKNIAGQLAMLEYQAKDNPALEASMIRAYESTVIAGDEDTYIRTIKAKRVKSYTLTLKPGAGTVVTHLSNPVNADVQQPAQA